MRKNKYRAKPCVIDGIRFASQKEGMRYATLKQLERAGEISKLECHPEFTLFAADTRVFKLERVGKYTADFRYLDQQERVIVEDVKAPVSRTEAYQLRKKIVEANYGITITEV